MNPAGYPFYFQSGQAFPNKEMMQHTLRMGMQGRPTPIPVDMLSILHSMVATYNTEVTRQEAHIQALEQQTQRLTAMVNYLSRFLPQNTPARQFPPPLFQP